MRSGLIAIGDSGSIGKTYQAISETLNTAMTLRLFPVAIAVSLLLVTGCNKKSGSTPRNSNKVRVGYIGLTCEAPIYAAYVKGFFKEEGLDPELVKCNWSTYKDSLA